MAKTKIVLTEGNYLLLNEMGWQGVAGELDEIWYVNIDDDLMLIDYLKMIFSLTNFPRGLGYSHQLT